MIGGHSSVAVYHWGGFGALAEKDRANRKLVEGEKLSLPICGRDR